MEDVQLSISRRTLRWELVRAACLGVLETAQLTFVLLIAIRAHDVPDSAKALLLGSMAVGLIASLVIVPLLRRLGTPVTRLAAQLQLLCAAGYALAAAVPDSASCLILGCSLGFFALAVQTPLQTQWLRHNYGLTRMGRRFATANLVRAGASVLFALAGGWWLERDFEQFPLLLVVFAGCGTIAAFAISRIPEPALPPASDGPPGVFRAMRWIRQDRIFGALLLSAMAMGMGVHMAMALRVDYLTHPRHGLGWSEIRIAFLTGTLPALVRLSTTFFWGQLFDRMNLITLRLILNLLFALALFLFFSTKAFAIIAVGAALAGAARGGGEIVWNLWVTKLAPAEHVAEYMSVHTFLTGIRGLAGPFLGFYLLNAVGLSGMLVAALICITLSITLLIPLIRVWKQVVPSG